MEGILGVVGDAQAQVAPDGRAVTGGASGSSFYYGNFRTKPCIGQQGFDVLIESSNAEISAFVAPVPWAGLTW